MASSLITHTGQCATCDGPVSLEVTPDRVGYFFRCRQGHETPRRGTPAEAAEDVVWVAVPPVAQGRWPALALAGGMV